MLKRTLLVCLTLCIAFSAEAQSRFRFGFRFNPLISLAGVQDKDKSDITGLDKGGKFLFSSGLMATYGFSEKVGLYTGAMFALKGFKSSVNFKPTNGDQRLIVHNANLTFLEIPLALHLTSNEVTTGMKIRGLFGLSANFLVGANTTRNSYIVDIMNEKSKSQWRTEADATNVNGSNAVETKRKSGTAGYNVFVPDFLVGAGVDWNIEGIGAFDFGISYHNALGNISKFALRGDDRASVSYLSFDLGYYF
ncbi:MAG: PorT family protein [Bacteroidetes bacterium]|nr:MAG: PorT family protein [Bacteroidota bacterium]